MDNADGKRTAITVAGQPAVNYEYDAGGRLASMGATVGGSPATFGINYDGLGRRSGIALPNGVATSYGYDNGSHLLNLEHKDPAAQILESLAYAYAPNGNRIAMDRQSSTPPRPTLAPVTTTSYNAANHMLTFGVLGMTYDDNGNMTSITNSCGLTNYTWDVRNRLTGISGYKPDCSALTASFVYDVIGRRTQKTINGRTIQYFYDGKDIVQEIENGLPTVNYIRTLNIDEPLARVELSVTPNKVRYYHADALGSIIGLSDENGQMVTTYAYDAFGQVAMVGEMSDNPLQYTGRENDGTGLYYYRARYYSAELQRFVSEDPIGLKGGINMFAYVGNHPVTTRDPLGLKGCGTGWIGESGILDRPGGYNFKKCCDAHDDCYDCKRGYEGNSKRECDKDFCLCLLLECLSSIHIIAHCPFPEYCAAVVWGGDDAYNRARRAPRVQ